MQQAFIDQVVGAARPEAGEQGLIPRGLVIFCVTLGAANEEAQIYCS